MGRDSEFYAMGLCSYGKIYDLEQKVGWISLKDDLKILGQKKTWAGSYINSKYFL